MLTISIINISIFLDLLLQLFDFFKSNLWFILSYEIIILTLIFLMAGRSTDKILKGLQGTASATVIARGAIDAYKAWDSSNPDDEDKSEENKDKKDDKKDDVQNKDPKTEVKDSKETNEK
jgi:hypothetical protein